MLGLMQNWPLTVNRIIEHAGRRHSGREVVWRRGDRTVVRVTYAEIERRARLVSARLVDLGVRPGDRVGTFAWNSAPHIEVWYGAMGIGAVCHPLNPRFHPEQLGWILAHAEDRVIFVSPDLLEQLSTAVAMASVRPPKIVVLDEAPIPSSVQLEQNSYEAWLAAGDPSRRDATLWGDFSEETACGLCYTSGTTGDPKGVLYSHRSNFLHTLITLQSDVFGLMASDVVLPLVPMFHANAWGLAFSVPAVGAKLVLPGRHLNPAAIQALILDEDVTFAAGVPTVWQALLEFLRKTGQSLGKLRRIVVGGAVCPEQMIRAFHDLYDVEVRHAWGMTEVSPLAPISKLFDRGGRYR
ncbi:MAG: long-chain fatty acid--CoA ligase [Bradyrhizobium sp.]|nr:long-chain fatty acid--CoA ligase [Bradyrhizobium sp.]